MIRALLLAGLAALALAVAPAASAQESAMLVAARSAGLVGERYDGYLGLTGAASPSLRAQVGAINIKRRSLYTQLAQSKGVVREDVGLVAACTLLARVAVGEAYLLPDNVWRRRRAGEAAARPDYCG
jgi:uncharacterized protein YdbL (DUF1318 family)